MKTSELLSKIEVFEFTEDHYAERKYNRIIPLMPDDVFYEFVTVNQDGELYWFDKENDILIEPVKVDNDFLRSDWYIHDKELDSFAKHFLSILEEMDVRNKEILEYTVRAYHACNDDNVKSYLDVIFSKLTRTSGYLNQMGIDKVVQLMSVEID